MEVSSKKLKMGLGIMSPKDRVRLDNELTKMPPEIVENRLDLPRPSIPAHSHCTNLRVYPCDALVCLSARVALFTSHSSHTLVKGTARDSTVTLPTKHF